MSGTTGVFPTAADQARSDTKRLGFFFWLLVFHLAVEYLRPQAIFPAIEPLRFPLILTVLTILAWLMAADKRILKDSLIVQQAAFIGLIAASVIWAVNQYWVFETFKVMTAYWIAGTLPIIAVLKSRHRLAPFFNCWIAVHVLLALWAIFHKGHGTSGFLEDENDLSLALNMAVPYAYYLLQRPRQPVARRLLYMAAVVTLAAGVVVSDSRGGFLGLVAVAMGIVFFSRQRLCNLLIIGTLGLIGLAVVSVEYIEEIQTIADAEDSTRNDRLYSWRRGWEMFLDHPLLGVGASNYPWRVEEYEFRSHEYRPGEQRLHGGRVSHSLYFTVIPEFGLTGTILFFSMAWMMYRRLSRVVRLDKERPTVFKESSEVPLLARAVVVSMLGLFISGAFISVLFYPHFWFLIGFVIALEKLAEGLVKDTTIKANSIDEAFFRPNVFGTIVKR